MAIAFHEPRKSPIKNPAHPPRTWCSPRTRANWTLVFIAVHILVAVASIVLNLSYIDIFQKIQDSQIVPDTTTSGIDTLRALMASLYNASSIAVVISFLIWIFRASRNLPALGATNPEFSPPWVVAWWFIPLAWIWQPYMVTLEIWKESHPERISPPAWFPVWWAAWLIAKVLATSNQIWLYNTDHVILATKLEIASDAILIPAVLLLIILVSRITANQIQKHQAMEGHTLTSRTSPNEGPRTTSGLFHTSRVNNAANHRRSYSRP